MFFYAKELAPRPVTITNNYSIDSALAHYTIYCSLAATGLSVIQLKNALPSKKKKKNEQPQVDLFFGGEKNTPKDKTPQHPWQSLCFG